MAFSRHNKQADFNPSKGNPLIVDIATLIHDKSGFLSTIQSCLSTIKVDIAASIPDKTNNNIKNQGANIKNGKVHKAPSIVHKIGCFMHYAWLIIHNGIATKLTTDDISTSYHDGTRLPKPGVNKGMYIVNEIIVNHPSHFVPPLVVVVVH